MSKISFLIALVILVAANAAPIHPSIDDSFEAAIVVQRIPWHEHRHWREELDVTVEADRPHPPPPHHRWFRPQQWIGRAFEDATTKKSLRSYNESLFDRHFLRLAEEKKAFAFINEAKHCDAIEDRGRYIRQFAWVRHSHFEGHAVVSGQLADIWSVRSRKGFAASLYVHNNNPVRLLVEFGGRRRAQDEVSAEESTEETTSEESRPTGEPHPHPPPHPHPHPRFLGATYIIDYIHFDSNVPHHDLFRVPDFCATHRPQNFDLNDTEEDDFDTVMSVLDEVMDGIYEEQLSSDI